MTTGAPARDAGFEAFRRALLGGYFWFSTILLGAVAVLDAGLLLSVPDRTHWLGIPLLGIIWIAAAVFSQTPFASLWRVLLLTPLTVAAIIGYAASLIGALPELPGGSGSVVFSFIKISVAVIGSMAERWTSGPLGTIVAVLLAEGAVDAGVLLAGGAVQFDVPTLLTVLGIALAQLLVGASRLRGRRSAEALDLAEQAEAEARARHLLEAESRALVHDTILNELAVLATTTPGRIPERGLDQLARSLRLAEGPAPQSAPRAGSEPEPTSELHGLVERFRADGLRVEVTGDPAVLDELDAEPAAAIALAVEQCLVNVLRHAGTDRAELVVTPEDESISIMVIDDGVGFDPEGVDAGRLGISGSVRGRVEALGGTVRVWSRPGAGASILLDVPRPGGEAS
ncbi:sensor histidine kinase [Homoserinibacter sp. YIM 151385]|uniref:sensor histidine kinase n=1 Tax=Homoserinibacter sp. YIM 151385 TaxID=2985506 RepID=UPI0022F05FAD|nr:ATP-binding protein [Homoserinibacter sp. YIM 151385]WBU37148.1 hypothetical protein OF852_09455 [Homoserinibacter sp. YIM 151385]